MIDFLKQLLLPAQEPTVAQTIVVVSYAIALGVLIGRVKVAKVSIGVAGVLFAGILFGHLGYTMHHETLEFLREFGLILFVYAVGLQVGPSFFSAFKKEGIVMNILAVSTVLLAAVIAYIVMRTSGTSADNVAGIMTGAITNTPSLNAAKAALADVAKANPGLSFNDPANGYAIAYPIGAIGEILVIIFGMKLFKINTQTEIEKFEAVRSIQYPHPSTVKCRITNPSVFGKTLKEADDMIAIEGVIASRLKQSGSRVVITPTPNTVLHERDVLLLVGLPDQLKRTVNFLGRTSTDTFILSDEEVESRDITVTNAKVTQKTIAQLNLEATCNTRITRVFRAGMEMVGTPGFILHFGDTVRVVGPKESLKQTIQILGNSSKKLQEPELATIFIGILIGVIVGSIPLVIPGLPVPIKLGLAAGPLMAAIFISRYGGVSRLHSYMNQSAMWFMRDFGICLFFAAVGLKAGKTFYSTFIHYNGWMWMFYGACITLIPAILLVLIARLVFKINFLQIAGMLGGSYTSPPTLAFCNNYFKNDIPAQAYTTVYPMVTICRILLAQLFVLLFAGG